MKTKRGFVISPGENGTKNNQTKVFDFRQESFVVYQFDK